MRVKYSKYGKRFFTKKEMATVKKDDAIFNSQVKRGEVILLGTGKHIVCQCGASGCIFYRSWDSKEYPTPTRQELLNKKTLT